MAIRVSGVELVVKNLSGFLNSLKKGEKAYGGFGDAAEKARRRIQATFTAMENSGRRYNTSLLTLEQRMRQVDRLTKTLSEAQKEYDNTLDETNQETEESAQALAAVEKAEDRLLTAKENVLKAMNQEIVGLNNLESSLLKYGYAQADAGKSTQGFLSSIMGVLGGTTSLAVVFPELAPLIAAAGVAFSIAKVGAGLFSKALGVVKVAINAVIAALKTFGNIAKSVFGFFIGILAKLTAPLRTFLQHIVEIASGIALWRFVRNLGVAFRNLTEEVMDAVIAFQGLEIRLDVLAARDYASYWGVDMVDAFKATAGASAELFDWMRQLAVTTPFNVADIANQFALANAMGLSIETTKRLTIATTNFTAALNLSDETLWRIVYNMGQMIQRGKLSGEEFRDLARNMIPIDLIMQNLADQAGMTKEAYRELALEGGVPVMDFLNEFIRIANTDYPDAAARMAKTWAGVTNNVKDFIQAFIGFDLLKPVFDRFTAIAADMLDKLLKNVTLMNSFKLMGQTLLRVFEYLIPYVDRFVDAVLNIGGALDKAGQKIQLSSEVMEKYKGVVVEVYNWAKIMAKYIIVGAMAIGEWMDKATAKIGDFSNHSSSIFSTLINKVFEWGLRFIESFSRGIAFAINYALIPAIKLVTQILSFFFKPGSPPLIAPDIDKWGAETMNEWIKGFTKADFSIFNDVASLVASYVKSLGDKIAEVDIIPVILDVRGNLASSIDAFKRGAISMADAVARVVNAIGGSESEFSAYITSLFKIAQAEDAVAAASAQVEEAQEAVDQLRDAYNALSDDSPELIIAELNLERATREAEEAQRDLNDVTEMYDTILDRLRAQLTSVTEEYDETVRLREIDRALSEEVLTAEERERLEMEKKGIFIKREIRAVEAQKDAAVSAAQQRLDDAKAEQDAYEALVETIKTQINEQKKLLQVQIDAAEANLESAKRQEDAAKAILEQLKLQADAQRETIEAQIEYNRLLQEQLDLLKKLKEEEEPPEAEQEPPEEIKPGFDLEAWLKDLQSIWDEAQKEFDRIKEAWEQAKKDITTAWETGRASEAINNLKTAFENLIEVIPSLTGEGGLIAGFRRDLEKVEKFIREKFGIPPDKNLVDWAIEKFEKAQERFNKIFGPWSVLVGRGFDLLALSGKMLALAWDLLAKKVGELGEIIGVDGDTIASWLLFIAAFPFFSIAGSIAVFATALALWAAAWRGAASVVIYAVEGVLKVLHEFYNVVVAVLDAIVSGNWANAGKVIVSATNNISKTIQDTLKNIEGSFTEFGTATSYIMETWSDFLVGNSIVPDTMEGIYKSVASGLKNTSKVWNSGISDMTKFAQMLSPDMSAQYTASYVSQVQAQPVFSPAQAGYGNIDQSTHVQVNPSYSNYQSEASVYFDVTAALAAAGR